MKYHPDKNKDPKAEETFRSITEAYDILSDPTKRQQYDEKGHQAFKPSDFANDFQFNMNDFFKHFDFNMEHFGSNHDDEFDFWSDEENNVNDDFQFDFGDIFRGYVNFDQSFDDEHSFFYSSNPPEQHCRTVTKLNGHTVSYVRECF